MAAERTLVSFLGNGQYGETVYRWADAGEYRSAYVAAAIAHLWRPDRVVVLATAQAERANGAGLHAALRVAGAPAPEIRRIPDGRGEAELWQQFEVLRGVVEQAVPGALLLDITHGFRAQPFFAGAVLSVLGAARQEALDARVVYGEYHADTPISPIWDLSLFSELIEWAQALGLFLRTGVAAPVVALGRRAQQREAARARHAGALRFPRIATLVTAIASFADDLATVRIASIITGYAQEHRKKPSAKGSARRLVEAVAACREEVQARLPPLALILDQLEEAARPLIAETLDGEAGRRALRALAKYYLDLGRYPEAAIVVREARVSRHARDARAVEVNAADFSDALRREAEQRFAEGDPSAREIASVRNDIEHGGFRRQPLAAEHLKRSIAKLVSDDPLPVPPHADAAEHHQATRGKTYFVSRHPGASEWAREHGIPVDGWVTHLDIGELRPGDTVIGTLPINLAAQVCERGGRYLHLSLELTPELRGRELTAAELNACGARIQEFEVRLCTRATDAPREA